MKNAMKQINSYIDSTFGKEDELLKKVICSIANHGMPSFSVSASTGKLLTMLISISGAKNVLEIGALGGYSGICLSRGFGKEGKLTSLELQDKYAKLAHQNLTEAGFGDQVSYLTGPALENLEKLVSGKKQYDFFFIDADKGNYENYLNYCIQLAEPGALIVIDNVLARGSVADETIAEQRHTKFMKNFNETVSNHPQLESIMVPLGDGLTIARVNVV